MTYGASQKIVNLTFKYLYCFDTFRNENKEKFKKCHMVLDSYILSWVKHNIDKKIIKYNMTWSNIEDYNEYSKIQNLISDYIGKKDKDLYVLEYEFILWPATLLYESAVSWFSTISDCEKKDIYDRFKINKLKDLISNISNECRDYEANNIDFL